MDDSLYPFSMVTVSPGAKKWVSATAVADWGDSQAIQATAVGRSTGNAFEIGAARFVNRSGSTAVVGLGVRYANSGWVAGQIDAANVYTDDTTDAQNSTAADFLLWQRLIATSNGFLVGASERFNTLGIIVSAAGDQTAPVLLLSYYNGTAWVDMTATLIVSDALVAAGTGEKVLAWNWPVDWQRGGVGTNIPANMYCVKVSHTVGTSGTIDPTASQVFLGYTQLVVGNVANLAQASYNYAAAMRFPRSGVSLVPLFSVASLANICEIQWRWY